jgi:hypothetical protein
MATAINSAVAALGVASVGGSGSYIQSISETDGKISAVTAAMPTKLSQFTNDSGFITAAATTGYVTTAVNGIQIGGRNLILNSSFSNTLNQWFYDSSISTIIGSSLQMTNNASQTFSRTAQSVFNIEGSTQYTVSIYIKSLTAGAVCGIYLWENDGKTANYCDNYHSFDTTGWQSFTITTQPDCTYIGVLIQLTTASSTVQFKQIKLEKGNKATDWTPAPEDVDAAINSAITTAETDAATKYLPINGNAASASKVNNALSWNGYSSGSFDGSAASSFIIPNNTNQLTNGAGFITSSASISGNAATATKLATARTIWGQSFDGTGNVDGTLSLNANGADGGTGGNACLKVTAINSLGCGHWNYLASFLAPNAVIGEHLFIPIGKSFSKGNSAGFNFFYQGDNNDATFIGLEFYGIGTNFALTKAGNVGIGTTSPAYKLDVAGTGRFQGDLVIGNTIIHASGSNGGINSIQPADDYIIGDCNIGGTMGLKSLNTASAGIGFYGSNGTNYGTLTASGSGLAWTGNILATGGVTAYTTSDKRLKKNIRPVDSLKVIRTLGGTYQFDYRKDNRHSIGFIAQNVRNSELSDIVGELDGYLRINYLDTRLISLALGASVELDDEVTRLKKKVSKLEKEVERLKAA